MKSFFMLMAFAYQAVFGLLTAGCAGGGCPDGLADCSGNCVDLEKDRENCGGC